MIDETFFELRLAIFGWQPYHQLWGILMGIGVAYLRATPGSWTFKPCRGVRGIATTQIYTYAGQERLSKLVVDI